MIKFYKHRKIYFSISIALILLGIISAFVFGIQLDIQFKGGSILKYTYEGTMDAEKTGQLIEEAIGRPTNCLLETNMARDEQKITVSLASNDAVTTQEQEIITSTILEAYPDSKLALAESLTVEPYIGAKFFRDSLFAVGLAFLLIMIYVGIRFRNIGGLSAGAMAIVALIHDCLIVTATFIVFRIPLNDSYIAAMLTIIGFSINDTIVVYDRIRENERLMGRKVTMEDLVDTSINQSMSRSINTSVAVFLSIAIVYIFAQIYDIDSIRKFALPMMFGTISGCYSTICIAGPLWTMWQNHKADVKKTAKTAKA